MKFGNHISAVVQSLEGGDHYIVPYTEIANNLERDYVSPVPIKRTKRFCFGPNNNEPPLTPTQKFTDAWRDALTSASESFISSSRSCWSTVYLGISAIPDTHALPLETAVPLYANEVGLEGATDLLSKLKGVLKVGQINAEGLRKLVNKFDKKVKKSDAEQKLTKVLISELYTSMVAVGLGIVETVIEIIRCSIEDMEYKENGGNDLPIEFENKGDEKAMEDFIKGRSKSVIIENEVVVQRANELQWLSVFTRNITNNCISGLVAHRGFHDPSGRSDIRPIENSLAAYEAAWTAGVHLCECDVVLTKDEKIVLAHDENFTRLALDSDSRMALQKVQDLTLKELIGLCLRNGVRAPLLADVLRSAAMIGGEARLVIEIKPGNSEVGVAVATFLLRYPELMERVALIISFDLYCLHQVRNAFASIAERASVGGGMRMRRSMTSLGLSRVMNPSSVTALNGSKLPRNSFLPGNSLALSDFNPMSLLEEDKKEDRALINPKFVIPKLLLLSVADPPELPIELFLDVEDMSPVEGWLKNPNGNLDGIYIRYQKKMKEPKGGAALKALTARYTVGMWLWKEDEDNYETMKYLMDECGVSYLNTDIPKDFY